MTDLPSKLTSKLNDFLSPKNPPARSIHSAQADHSQGSASSPSSPQYSLQISPAPTAAIPPDESQLNQAHKHTHVFGLDYASSKDSSATESLPPSPLVDATAHPAVMVITPSLTTPEQQPSDQTEPAQGQRPSSPGSIFQFPGFAQSMESPTQQPSASSASNQRRDYEKGLFSFAFQPRIAGKRMSPAIPRKSAASGGRSEGLSGLPHSAPASFQQDSLADVHVINEPESNTISFFKKFSRPRRDSNPTKTLGSVFSRFTTELRGTNSPATFGGRRATISSHPTHSGFHMTGATNEDIAIASEIKTSMDDTKIPTFDYEGSKLAKFRKILEQPHVDLNELRRLSWSGIPGEVRPMVWQLLMDYLPCNSDRRQATLSRKRNEYFECLNRYFGDEAAERSEYEEGIFRQIHIDMPRTHPLVPLFQQVTVQEMLERILYVWSIRHPASGYVQGINDLVTPFFVIFLSQFVVGDVEVCDISEVSSENLSIVEADSYWCMSKLLDSIQDNYTFAQPGIQRQVHRLKELIAKTEPQLYSHLEGHQIQFLQFAFRWMNCLLIREIPLKHIIRMWDTYLVEENGFVGFHLYVCTSFLRSWSSKIQGMDFQETLMFLQNLPTEEWALNDIELLLSNAFILKELYHGSGHTRS